MDMKLGEVSPGGVGDGLNGMLVFVLLSVFIAGLMVGRTPEYLGKKIQATEMKLVVLYILVDAVRGARVHRGLACSWTRSEPPRIFNPGPHGFTEILYAFTSAANNNGSAFAGITANTHWMNTALRLAMLSGGSSSSSRRSRSPARSRASSGAARPARSRPTRRCSRPGHRRRHRRRASRSSPSLSLGPIVEQLSL